MEEFKPESIKEIIVLNKEIKRLVALNSPENLTIRTKAHFDVDFFSLGLSSKDLNKILKEGLFLEDVHLYGKDKRYHKHKKKCCYCIHKLREFIYLRCFIIGLYKKPTVLILFHTSPVNKDSTEERIYTEIMKKIKEFSP